MRREIQIVLGVIGLLLTTTFPGWATTYYFSSSGKDTRSAAQAQQPHTPWRSLAKLQEIMPTLQPGDSVLFRRGNIFYGRIRVTRSGQAGRPIVFGAYGTGAQPIIDGSVRLTGWQPTGVDKRWQTICGSCETVPALYRGASVLPLGRFPNRKANNGGYLTIRQGFGRNSFEGVGVPQKTSWVGAEAVVRSSRWTLDRTKISQQSGNRLTLAENTTYPIPAAFGFFIQNHPATLDLADEWSFEAERKRITWYTNLAYPNRQRLFAAYHPHTLDIRSRKHIQVRQLTFRRSRISNIYMWSAESITLSDIKSVQGAADGIQLNNCQQVTIVRSNFNQNANNGVVVKKGKNILIQDNTLTTNGTVAGMGASGNGSYNALVVTGDYIEVKRNKVTQTGYIGVDFRGSNISISNNEVSHFCTVKDDGAGIYTWAQVGERLVNRRVNNNVVLHGVGAGMGTNRPDEQLAEGIYLDDRTHNVEVDNNTVAYCKGSGIYVHNSRAVSLHHNTMFDNHTPLKMIANGKVGDPEMQIRRCQVHQNVLVGLDRQRPLVKLISVSDDVKHFATFDRNQYVHPFRPYGNIQVTQQLGTSNRTDRQFSLRSWKRFSEQDASSTLSPYYYRPFRVLKTRGVNPFENAGFDSTTAEWRVWARYGNASLQWHKAGHKGGGSLQVGFTSRTGRPDAKLLLSGHHGNLTVRTGVHYRLKLSMKSSKDDQPIKLILRRSGGDREELAPTHILHTHTEWKEYEFIFVANANSTSARLDVLMTEENGTIWMDEVSLKPVTVEFCRPQDSVRFVYNTEEKPTTTLLSVPRVGTDFRSYDKSAEIAPYQSLVLLRTDEATAMVADRKDESMSESDTEGVTRTGDTGQSSKEHRFQTNKDVITGLDNPASKEVSSLMVYPNPARHQATVSYLTEKPGVVQLVISDAQGRLMYEKNQTKAAGAQVTEIPVSQLPDGWYTVRVMTADRVFYVRLMVR